MYDSGAKTWKFNPSTLQVNTQLTGDELPEDNSERDMIINVKMVDTSIEDIISSQDHL